MAGYSGLSIELGVYAKYNAPPTFQTQTGHEGISVSIGTASNFNFNVQTGYEGLSVESNVQEKGGFVIRRKVT